MQKLEEMPLLSSSRSEGMKSEFLKWIKFKLILIRSETNLKQNDYIIL